jgi:hypothetical protein
LLIQFYLIRRGKDDRLKFFAVVVGCGGWCLG